jgi:hypothetical protein
MLRLTATKASFPSCTRSMARSKERHRRRGLLASTEQTLPGLALWRVLLRRPAAPAIFPRLSDPGRRWPTDKPLGAYVTHEIIRGDRPPRSQQGALIQRRISVYDGIDAANVAESSPQEPEAVVATEEPAVESGSTSSRPAARIPLFLCMALVAVLFAALLVSQR